jgi:hypothetical protein
MDPPGEHILAYGHGREIPYENKINESVLTRSQLATYYIPVIYHVRV